MLKDIFKKNRERIPFQPVEEEVDEQNEESESEEDLSIPEQFRPHKARIKEMFDFSLLERRVNAVVFFKRLEINAENSTMEVDGDFEAMQTAVQKEIVTLSENFNPFLQLAFYEEPDITKNQKLQDRLNKLTQYFAKKIQKVVLANLPAPEMLEFVHSTLKKQIARVEAEANSKYDILTNYTLSEIINPTPKTKREMREARRKTKMERGEVDLPKNVSANETLKLWQKGKNIDEISEMRGIAVGSIERHLGHFIIKGEIDAKELIPPEKMYKLIEFFTTNPTKNFAYVKAVLGGEFDYREMRFALCHLTYLEKDQKKEQKEIRKKQLEEEAVIRQAEKKRKHIAHQERLIEEAKRRKEKERLKLSRLQAEEARKKVAEAKLWKNVRFKD
ncbi:MAG: helix-turn-helix domain-containing protein [Prevotellaceae bacterium]|jgi:hypothetical protein|nr:helix-turn-helix domain-containing protein [Prevotellaceae bacterium]